MIWDTLFWLWFAIVAVLFLLMLSDEATAVNLLFGSVLAGMGFAKIAGERSFAQPAVSRKTLDKLRK
jgi:hypothetical protein